MYLESLNRQMAVTSFDGAARLTRLDKGYWNVVSIAGPHEAKAHLPLARTIHFSCFDDIEDGCSTKYRSPRQDHIAGIFAFIESLGHGIPSAPLLIHCQQGISRSSAVALSWIYGHLPASSNRSSKAIDLVLELRPQAKPNRLVLTLGLLQFMPIDQARQLAERMLADPRLVLNRFERVPTMGEHP